MALHMSKPYALLHQTKNYIFIFGGYFSHPID